jgi:hypothetical protein
MFEDALSYLKLGEGSRISYSMIRPEGDGGIGRMQARMDEVEWFDPLRGCVKSPHVIDADEMEKWIYGLVPRL